MKSNATISIKKMLIHEGGFVNHPRDPGGATNRGVTIGTLRRLGMDIDGDGDVDVTDLKRLTEADAVRVYKRFYWDKVEADLLPPGVDYVVADFAVNSGPKRAAIHLQRALGVKADGDVGPITVAAAHKADFPTLIDAICDSRLRFMQGIRGGKLWRTFGKGWSRRVSEVRSYAQSLSATQAWPPKDKGPEKRPVGRGESISGTTTATNPADRPPTPGNQPVRGFWGFILALFRG